MRLQHIFDVRDGTHDTPRYVTKGIPLVTSKNLKSNGIDFSTAKLISEKDYESISLRSGVAENDILFAMIGSIGNPVIVAGGLPKFAIKNMALFKYYNRTFCNELFLYFFLSYVQNEMKKIASGGVQSFISLDFLRRYLFPLPPLAEQERIVARIKEFEPLIAAYDHLEQEESRLEAELPDRLRKSILQYAIEGKLVPQDPADEPASELLKRIRAEKEALIKAGKIKRDKVDSYIYRGDDNSYYQGNENIDDILPFDIPDSWAWCRLGFLVDFSKNASVNSAKIDGNAWVLDLEDIEKDTGKLLAKKRMKDAASKSEKHIFYAGNVLYSKLRPYLNKAIIADEDGYCTSEILAFDFGQINNEYAQIYLMSPFFVDCAMSDAYGVKMPRLGSAQGNAAFMPIPPLPEQKRIVDAVNSFKSMIKSL